MSWIKFHSALNQGDKRAIPREARYIYLELSLLAREFNGVVPISKRLDVVDAIHDLIGGDRRQIEDSIEYLFHSDENDEPMLSVAHDGTKRVIRINAWQSWNVSDDSAERVRRYREKKKNDVHESKNQNGSNLNLENIHLNVFQKPQENPNVTDVTRYTTVTPVTVTRYVNDFVTDVTSLDQRREDKIKIPPPSPPNPPVQIEPRVAIAEHVRVNPEPQQQVSGERVRGRAYFLDFFKKTPHLTAADMDRVVNAAMHSPSNAAKIEDVTSFAIGELQKELSGGKVRFPSGWLRNKLETLLCLSEKQFKDIEKSCNQPAALSGDAALLADIQASEARFAKTHSTKKLESQNEKPQELAKRVAKTVQTMFGRPEFSRTPPPPLPPAPPAEPPLAVPNEPYCPVNELPLLGDDQDVEDMFYCFDDIESEMGQRIEFMGMSPNTPRNHDIVPNSVSAIGSAISPMLLNRRVA
jgi:hypothetical protein